MNTDNVTLVVLLVIGIVVLSNLAMFAMVRGSRGMNFDWLKNVRGTINQPFNAEENELGKLRQQVSALENDDSGDSVLEENQ